MTKRIRGSGARGWRDRARDTAEASAQSLALWRPAWEVRPVLLGGCASAFALALGAAGEVPAAWAAAWGGGALLVAGVRLRGAWRVWRRRAPLSGFAPRFMSLRDLVRRMRSLEDDAAPQAARRGADAAMRLTAAASANDPAVLRIPEAEPAVHSVWFGLGFPWTPVEAQKLYEISRVDWRVMQAPAALRGLLRADPGLTDADVGLPVIHGVGTEEKPIERPLKSLGGGTLVVGTTQAGKGVVLTSLIAQAVLRGEAVVVIDPKSSKRLRRAVQAACRAAGRPAPLEFHPAFPQRGVRLDPLGSFTRATEIASRIVAVLPPDNAGAFQSFAWQAVHVMAEGLLFAGRRPSLMAFRRLLESGVEELLEACLRKDLDRRIDGWEERVKTILKTEPEALSAPLGSRASKRLLATIILWERTAGEDPEAAVGGLIAVFRHSREHYAKITASLVPALAMLTSGPLGRSLSPDPADDDERPIVTIDAAMEAGAVLYLGLDALPDGAVAGALGSILLSDLAAAAGRRYNLERSGDESSPVSLFVDETANVINPPLIEILNKGMEAGITCTCAMQTVSDLAARLGSESKARMTLGNLNNLIALRTKDQATQAFICEAFGRTTVWESAATVSTTADDEVAPTFRASVSRSLSGRRDTVVPMDALGSLPNTEFFASLSGGRLWKGRMPILIPELDQAQLFDEAGGRLPAAPMRERLRTWTRGVFFGRKAA